MILYLMLASCFDKGHGMVEELLFSTNKKAGIQESGCLLAEASGVRVC